MEIGDGEREEFWNPQCEKGEFSGLVVEAGGGFGDWFDGSESVFSTGCIGGATNFGC